MSYSIRTDVPLSKTEQELQRSLELWGASNVTVDYNVENRRRDNFTLTRAERAVTVSWTTRGGHPMALAMDEQDRPRDNLRVLFLAIDSMRLNEKRGIDQVMRTAYLQLDGPAAADPWRVLGLSASATFEQAQAAYRALAKAAHPDLGGSPDGHEMAELNAAWGAVKKARGW